METPVETALTRDAERAQTAPGPKGDTYSRNDDHVDVDVDVLSGVCVCDVT